MGNRIKELFDYEDGKLLWKVRTSNRVSLGDTAGTMTSNNYYMVRYDGLHRMLHRVIWDYFNDSCEGFIVDHTDGDSVNNRIENLRLANYSTNAFNSKSHEDSAVPYKGVSKHKDQFRAQISVNGSRVHLGLFDTAEKASEAYRNKAKGLHGEYYRKAQ